MSEGIIKREKSVDLELQNCGKEWRLTFGIVVVSETLSF